MDDTASVASRASLAPSLHPSMAGTAISESCHPDTIGAGDDTLYWDYHHRAVEKSDLGHKCRECKRPFQRLGEPMTERRGARVSMRYHAACFSGFADPRSQLGSSTHSGKLAGTQLDAAPTGKAGPKMRTSSHFDSGGRPHERTPGGSAGKSGMGLTMGSNGFGAKSSRGAGQAANLSDADKDLSGFDEALSLQPAVSHGGGSGLSEEALKAHARGLARVAEE